MPMRLSIVVLSLFSVIDVYSSFTRPIHSMGYEEKKMLYHSREYEERTFQDLRGRFLMSSFGPKERLGGLGPGLTVEVSPWVKSVNWVKNLIEHKSYEFVFDPDINSVYIGIPCKCSPGGHPCIRVDASIANPYGGTIVRNKNTFRTDEQSGHYGRRWHDKIRLRFLETMFSKGLYTLHEPWVRDSTVQRVFPEILKKKIASMPLSIEDERKLSVIDERDVFARFQNDELKLYQDNFLRRFGNSILNPLAFPLCVVVSPYSSSIPSSRFYEQEGDNVFSLKSEFAKKGTLDMKFYLPEYGFLSHVEAEDMLFKIYE